jgi:hypothetical protein
MRHRRLAILGIALTVLVVVVAAGSAWALLVRGQDGNGERASFAEVPADVLAQGVYCSDSAPFCLTPESLAAGYAVATVNQRSFTLHAGKGGCPAALLPGSLASTSPACRPGPGLALSACPATVRRSMPLAPGSSAPLRLT